MRQYRGRVFTFVRQIERVQRSALYIVLGTNYLNYENAMKTLACESLSDRREKLCVTFAVKSEKHEKYKTWFCLNAAELPNLTTRNEKPLEKFMPVKTRTDRYKRSPCPILQNY